MEHLDRITQQGCGANTPEVAADDPIYTRGTFAIGMVRCVIRGKKEGVK